jgi:hypothetical protein
MPEHPCFCEQRRKREKKHVKDLIQCCRVRYEILQLEQGREEEISRLPEK